MKAQEFIKDLSWDNLSSATRQMARICLLDTLGCALAGSRSEGFPALCQAIGQLDAGCDSPVWSTEFSMGLPWSIFLNSYAAAYFDMDDGHRAAQGHPGAAVVPAALCVAHQLGATGRALLEAIVVGYEIAVRSALIMRSLGRPRKGSGGWVVTGVAAAVARLLNLPVQNILHALGLAEYYAPQAPQDRSASHPSQNKEGIPWAAYTGYLAAFLSSTGYEAMRPYLADASECENLTVTYEIENAYHKMYASCRWAHPAMDGLENMLKETKINIPDIAEIRIRTFEKALLLARCEPVNTLEALYSIPFAVASFLVNGQLGPHQMSGASLQDRSILGLAKKIKLIEDPELTRLFPEKCLQKIEVILKDGTHRVSKTFSAKGDPSEPYTFAELTQKFKRLSLDVLGDRWQAVVQAIEHFEDAPAGGLFASLGLERK